MDKVEKVTHDIENELATYYKRHVLACASSENQLSSFDITIKSKFAE